MLLREQTSYILTGKRDSRRHSTTSFSENVVVAGTCYQIEYQRGNFNIALYFLQGNYAEARFHYETAAKLNPNDNTLKQNLAKLQRLEKRNQK